MMSTERDELAETISNALDAVAACPTGKPTETDYIVADAILAAGYRKPRTVTTTEELDALPEGAPIWGSSHSDQTPGTGSPYRKLESGEWWDFENCYSVPSDDILLPAIVIHEGSKA